MVNRADTRRHLQNAKNKDKENKHKTTERRSKTAQPILKDAQKYKENRLK